MSCYYVGRLTIDIGTSDTLELPVSEKSISYFSPGLQKRQHWRAFSYGIVLLTLWWDMLLSFKKCMVGMPYREGISKLVE